MRYLEALRRADQRILGALRGWGGDRRVAYVVRTLSWSGEHGAVWLLTGLVGALTSRERRDHWLRATTVVTGAHLASVVAKRLVRRPRPGHGPAPLVHTSGRHGFPSSHAASSAAAAVAFGALVPRGRKPPVRAVAAGICLSRVVAGAHYPSDVAAGAALGALAARLGVPWPGGRRTQPSHQVARGGAPG